MNVQTEIFDRLSALGIEHQSVSHPAVRTIGDCKPAERELDALIPKNLFLAPRNLSAFYLCLVHPDAAFRTAEISKQIGSSRLSFGPEEKLAELLRTFPGAISPMGLIFPEARAVRLLIDGRLRDVQRLAFHPNDNRRTLAMSGRDFFDVFLPATGHEPRFVSLG